MAHFYTESFSLEEMFSSYSYSRVGKIPSVLIKIKKYGIFRLHSAFLFFPDEINDSWFYTLLQISTDKINTSLCK